MGESMQSITTWIYNNKPLKEIPEGSFGYVYRITFNNGDFYIGSKGFYSIRNPKISKKRSKELYSGKGRRPTRERKVSESNWREYRSSSKLVQERLNTENATFEIIKIYSDRNSMLFWEAYYIICEFANGTQNCLNDWISIKCKKP